MSFERPGPVEESLRNAISPIEDIIEEARQGRMFVLVDHEDRENEGDLVIPAGFANDKAINFMATHGRGLICLTLPSDRIEQLGLPMMAMHNSSRHETAFTVSIEAREGVSTGISAADRALTVATAIDPQCGQADIATPGHVFPLRARKGGVLVRAGHTEAGCDISRLAGHYPASVICEIMKEDGTMARLPDLIEFSEKHGLKIGTISDLISYRSRKDNLVELTDRRMVDSEFGGSWDMHIFTDQTHGLAAVNCEIDPCDGVDGRHLPLQDPALDRELLDQVVDHHQWLSHHRHLPRGASSAPDVRLRSLRGRVSARCIWRGRFRCERRTGRQIGIQKACR